MLVGIVLGLGKAKRERARLKRLLKAQQGALSETGEVEEALRNIDAIIAGLHQRRTTLRAKLMLTGLPQKRRLRVRPAQ